MKINTGTIGIIIAALFLWVFLENGCHRRSLDDEEVVKSDTTNVVVEVPEKTGEIDKPVPKIEYIERKIYVPITSEEDKELLRKYKKANDSLKQELYKESTKRNTFVETFSNDDIEAVVKAEVGGSNLYEISMPSYIVKKQNVTTPQVTSTVLKKKRELSLGSEIGIPTRLGNPIIFKGNISLENKNNMRYKVGYDTEGNIWAGVDIIIF